MYEAADSKNIYAFHNPVILEDELNPTAQVAKDGVSDDNNNQNS